FLIRLDDSYLAIRRNILTRESLPLVKSAFAIGSGEESHRNVTSALWMVLVKKDDSNPALTNQCDMFNSVVVTRILNSMSFDLSAGAIYAKTAYEMWKDFNDTYDKVDDFAVFNLHKFDVMISLPSCACKDAKHFESHNQLIKLMQFLIRLDNSYLAIRSNILTRESLPLVKTVFAVVSGEESHKNVTSVGTAKPTVTAFAAKTFD
nr:hypothetical protein [Tanacetum cinerariifolium]